MKSKSVFVVLTDETESAVAGIDSCGGGTGSAAAVAILRWLSAQCVIHDMWNMFQHLWHSQMSSVRFMTSMQIGHR